MTAEPRRADQVLDQLAVLLRASYGFTDVAIGERLEGGYANDLFHVTADGGVAVLRVKYPPVHADDIAWEHRLQHVLARQLDEVQAPLVAVDGSTYVSIEQRIAWLLPFVAGETADPAREQHRLAAARALGDFFPGNVLVTADRVVAVIDWEEAQFDWVTWDLAGALGSFCGVDDVIDGAAAARFVAAYRAAGCPRSIMGSAAAKRQATKRRQGEWRPAKSAATTTTRPWTSRSPGQAMSSTRSNARSTRSRHAATTVAARSSGTVTRPAARCTAARTAPSSKGTPS